MYGNIAKAHSKDKKTRYYYYCKNTVTPTGHECSFRLNIEQTEINKFVAKVISAMVSNPRFIEAIQAKIGTAVDTEDMEKQIAVLQGQLKQAFGTKSRLERQMDTLDINDAHYDRKILDLQRRYDEQYDTIEEIEVQIGELQSQIRSIQQEKISGDSGISSYSESSCFTRSILALGLSILLIATMISTPAAFAWLIASTV